MTRLFGALDWATRTPHTFVQRDLALNTARQPRDPLCRLIRAGSRKSPIACTRPRNAPRSLHPHHQRTESDVAAKSSSTSSRQLCFASGTLRNTHKSLRTVPCLLDVLFSLSLCFDVGVRRLRPLSHQPRPPQRSFVADLQLALEGECSLSSYSLLLPRARRSTLVRQETS